MSVAAHATCLLSDRLPFCLALKMVLPSAVHDLGDHDGLVSARRPWPSVPYADAISSGVTLSVPSEMDG